MSDTNTRKSYTPELKEDFKAAVRAVKDFHEKLKILVTPEGFEATPKNLALQWVWQSLVIAKAAVPGMDEGEMLHHIRSELEDPFKNPLIVAMQNQMHLTTAANRLKKEGNFPDIPEIPDALVEVCDFD